MDSGNTAFVLICAALVLMMTPALAFFYGGLVQAKSVVSMMMLSFGSLALISLLWVVYGYAISFANPGNPGYVGIPGFIGINLGDIGLEALLDAPPMGGIPPLAFAAFQGTFAIITVALISGAVADRILGHARLLSGGELGLQRRSR